MFYSKKELVCAILEINLYIKINARSDNSKLEKLSANDVNAFRLFFPSTYLELEMFKANIC